MNHTKFISACDKPPRPRGMTLVELLLALAVTAVIASVIAIVLSAVSYGTTQHVDQRSMTTRLHVINARLGAAIRSSRMLLARGDDYLVLWMADTNGNHSPDLSELRRIERAPSTNSLVSYKAPSSLPASQNTTYDLNSTDFNAVTSSLCGHVDFPQELWATKLTNWTTSLNASNPQAATLVSYRLQVTFGDATDSLIDAAALRNNNEVVP